jgi:hypothetical protein
MMWEWWGATVRRTKSPNDVSSEAVSVVLSFSAHTCFWGGCGHWSASHRKPRQAAHHVQRQQGLYNTPPQPFHGEHPPSLCPPSEALQCVRGPGCVRGALEAVAPRLQLLRGSHTKHVYQGHKHSDRLYDVPMVFGWWAVEGSAGQCHLQPQFFSCSCLKPRNTQLPARGNRNS